MKIIIAKTSGFCMGVRRAVEMVLDAPDEHQHPISTYGPLIHNPQVLEILEEKGISAFNEPPAEGSGTVLIRAHGVPPETKDRLAEVGFKVIDATCPRVIKVQTIIKMHARKGYAIIIAGDRNHPEIIGLRGYGGDKSYVVKNLAELQALPGFENAIIVAQTTLNTHLWQTVKNWATENHPHYQVFETICDSTERRQAEVQRLAESVDAVIVVGGRSSGNTKRLVDIARQAGKPAYHIENENDLADLDLEALTDANQIGITAGASTPNWVIKKVYRALEAMLFKRKQGWRRLAFEIQRTLLLTNVYVAIGAGALCYACNKLQGIYQTFPYILISMLYVQSMHILNRLTDTRADRYNDPSRAKFYDRYKLPLAILAGIAGGAGLVIAFSIGIFPFMALLVMSLLGLSYNLKMIPPWLIGAHYQKLRDIPGSKTLLIALAWGIVTAVLPPLSKFGRLHWVNVLVALWAIGIVFVRTAFFDILDMQGDRLVGKETIPILLGEKRSMQVLKIILIILTAMLAVLSALHLTSSLGFALLLCPVFIGLIIVAYERAQMFPGIRLEFLLETQFILAGMITFVWLLFS
ncbi:MAG: 4-hydroxy-3-methylbut-2-enyl diphosphate reductase [Deltaproteobacteria bacterium]|jgi:4-hydroxy-3-methylbut-2-enyl diphosphate reductase|nr:4-hydroxy-3-methylbut-2-enyl diphosphate reductase [Deltaproteobacteria bacterium]